MKNLLYIGNNLNTKSNNISSIQYMNELFLKEGYSIHLSSSYSNKILRLLDMLFSCFKYRNWADFVIIDTYSSQNFFYALLCSQFCRILKLEYIPSLNGGNLPMRLNSNPKLSQLIFNNAKINISPSLYLKNAFEKRGYKNIVHIPNAIQIDNYPIVNKNYDAIRLLWVRSFSKIYNPEMAVRVLKKIIDLGYDAELCMIGPDSDGSYGDVKSLTKILNVNVEFTGKLSKAEWINKSKNYNIFLNTTNFDNMPVSVIEAMALGFPVVSTNAGGMAFLLQHEKDGLLVEKEDIEAMISAIIRVYEDEELRQRLISNARQKAESFAWAKIKQQWYDILN